ncbi:glycosyltransferase [Clostridium ragsdalei]|uniref:glycosyltransferase n=1 Tax=Clostridium ragsdalei TaxID=217158 RepID=UPI001428AFCA|nr:glycosyltransferase [Clostridium ragsdalei]
MHIIRYYKSNNEIAQKGKLGKLIVGIKAIYNPDTVKEINAILDAMHVDFALVHNTSPIISNSIYKILMERNIPVLKYLQNYNLMCLNGAIDHGECCKNCSEHLWIGVKQRCYKNSVAYSLIKYISKKEFDKKYRDKIAGFMPNSEFVRDRHVQYGLNINKMNVMYNYIEGHCVNDEKIIERQRYLYFGRISKEKGVFTIIKAFQDMIDLQLDIMGSGELVEQITKYIREHGLKNVRYIGSRTGKELAEVIHEAKAVIVSSEWDEPLPRTIMESYLQGTPVVGTDRGGIPEMINEGQTGYIYKSGDVRSLKCSISRMESLSDDQYTYMRLSCLEEAKNKYTKEKYVQRFIECIGRHLK